MSSPSPVSPLPRLRNQERHSGGPHCLGPIESAPLTPRGKTPHPCHFSIGTQSREVRWQLSRITFYWIFSTTLKDKMSSTFPIKGNWDSQGLLMVYQRSHSQLEPRPGFEWNLLNSNVYTHILIHPYTSRFLGVKAHSSPKHMTPDSMQLLFRSYPGRAQRKRCRGVALGR